MRSDLEVMSQKAQLAAGDTLFLFSDGIVEVAAVILAAWFGGALAERQLQALPPDPEPAS